MMRTAALAILKPFLMPTLVVALLGAGGYTVKQWFEIRGLRSELSDAKDATKDAQDKLATCVVQRKELETANAQFAERVTAQSMAVEAMAKAAEAKQAEAAGIAREAARKAAEQQGTIEWLSKRMLSPQPKPGECPEAEAARVVREGLTR